jgi:hypothetical protein
VIPEPTDTEATTVVDAVGGLSLLGRWLVQFVLRITVRRRT